MYRRTVISLLVIGGVLLGSFASAGEGVDEAALVDRVKASINKRMYDTCKDVAIVHEADALYRGHAEFVNGVRVNLEVTINNGAIAYRFLEQSQGETETLRAQVEELEQLIDQLEAEIDRLTDLCQQAGIDTTPIAAESPADVPEDVNEPFAEADEQVAMPEDEPLEMPVETTPVFSWQLYHRIEKDMSYAEVVDILGDEGHSISGSYFDGAENEVVVWTNDDDSHICVVFRNGAVLVKTQFGLPEAATTPTQ